MQVRTAVILRAPKSLTQAIQEAAGGKDGIWPRIGTSTQAFFKRSQEFSWEFFRGVYEVFNDCAVETAKAVYSSSFHPLRERFWGIWAVDGSRLDAIAHRLKILWNERAVVLPGCLTAFYDLFHGVTRELIFDPDAASAEILRAEGVLKNFPKDLLLLGDRLYCSVRFFGGLSKNGLWGLFRRNKTIGLTKVRTLRRKRMGDVLLEETIVEAGSGATTPAQTLRRIRLKCGRRVVRDLLTNVLDPARLRAEEALDLYGARWSIERLFYDLKEVLNLHQFYAANPNAVAMQVYAAAIVHTAMRIAQGRIAASTGIRPEEISTEKLFPRVASASLLLVHAQLGYLATCRANPGRRLREPNWRREPFATVPLSAVRSYPRSGKRRKRRFCESRSRWKSMAHISGSRI